MPRFIELGNYENREPHEQLVASLNRVRAPLSYAYCLAFQAFERSRDLLRESECAADYYSGWGDQENATELQESAFTKDVEADMFASLAVLFAGDVLRRYHWELFHKHLTLKGGYGRKHNGDVTLTALLEAGGNAIRHASAWAGNVRFPYPDDESKLTPEEKRALRSIRVIERAFGTIGAPIVNAPSWDIVFWMNAGDDHKPDENYDNYEKAIVLTALDMASAKSPEALAKLKAAVDWIDFPE
jgi:hypothetical protein